MSLISGGIPTPTLGSVGARTARPRVAWHHWRHADEPSALRPTISSTGAIRLISHAHQNNTIPPRCRTR